VPSPWATKLSRRHGETAAQTLVLDYNDSAGLDAAFAEHGRSIACAIVEPVAGNMNLVARRPDFSAAARPVHAHGRC